MAGLPQNNVIAKAQYQFLTLTSWECSTESIALVRYGKEKPIFVEPMHDICLLIPLLITPCIH